MKILLIFITYFAFALINFDSLQALAISTDEIPPWMDPRKLDANPAPPEVFQTFVKVTNTTAPSLEKYVGKVLTARMYEAAAPGSHKNPDGVIRRHFQVAALFEVARDSSGRFDLRMLDITSKPQDYIDLPEEGRKTLARSFSTPEDIKSHRQYVTVLDQRNIKYGHQIYNGFFQNQDGDLEFGMKIRRGLVEHNGELYILFIPKHLDSEFDPLEELLGLHMKFGRVLEVKDEGGLRTP